MKANYSISRLRGRGRAAALAICLGLLAPVCGAEQVWGRSEAIASPNAKYSAKITERASGVMELSVFTSSGKRLWGRTIDWNEGFSGFLSNDGSVFAVVNDDYSTLDLLVFIYSKEGQAGYSMRQIVVPPEFLEERGGEKVWIDPVQGNVNYQYDGSGKPRYLDIRALSGKTFEIGLDLG